MVNGVKQNETSLHRISDNCAIKGVRKRNFVVIYALLELWKRNTLFKKIHIIIFFKYKYVY